MQLFQRPQKGSRLSDMIRMARSAETLRGLPDRLADVIEKFDSTDCDPRYRKDVFALLHATTALSECLLNESYSLKQASEHIGNIMYRLPVILQHLTNRATLTGYSILFPKTNTLFSQHFTTESEANEQRARLIALGASRNCVVVPVQIVAEFAIRPDRPKEQYIDPDPMDGPIPTGIHPVQPLTAQATPFIEEFPQKEEPQPELRLAPEEPSLEERLKRLNDQHAIPETPPATAPETSQPPETQPATGTDPFGNGQRT